MINSIEDLRSSGTLPTGPVSAWPQHRNVAGPGMQDQTRIEEPVEHDKKVKVSKGQMARNLINTAQQMKGGFVSDEIRNERWETCKSCPHLIEKSKRCSECGCYMLAKVRINGDPKQLCPKKKWAR